MANRLGLYYNLFLNANAFLLNKSSIAILFFCYLSSSVFSQGCPASGTTSLGSNPNTYYPGLSPTLGPGSTSIMLGAVPAGYGITPINAGDLILIIQMQGSQIITANSVLYGAGSSGGFGFTSTNLLAGNMEFAVAVNSVSLAGGSLNISAGITNTYANSTFGSFGQYTYQVIRVPSYYNLQLIASINTPVWNGSVGGITVLKAINQLDFNGKTINAAGAGFRGGAGKKLTGMPGAPLTDRNNFVAMAPPAYTANGSKGEGIAGTPKFVNSNGVLLDNTVEGYPGGSYGRGAPGNAGGGGNDYNPPFNNQNCGGGGGGNGGRGGSGGRGGGNPLAFVPGRGGCDFILHVSPFTIYYSPSRLIMGGGGGAGVTNEGTPDGTGIASSGAAGGGIVIVNTSSIIGTGSINVSGVDANSSVLNDGSGGGGAGGSILIYAESGHSGITAMANGGNGGSNDPLAAGIDTSQYGPGGGGGGGVIFSNAPLNASSIITGGLPGKSHGVINYTPPDSSFAAIAGSNGALTQNISISQLPANMLVCGAQYGPTVAGTINPEGITIASGTSPGIISATASSGGSCGGFYEYQWQSSTDGTNFMNISGATGLTYTPGNLSSGIYYRRRTKCVIDTVYTNSCQVTIASASLELNYIRVRDITKPAITDTITANGLTDPNDVKQTTQYFDGLGRLIQTVSRKATPSGNDLVIPTVYDPFGREAVKYLPYASSTNIGGYKQTSISDLSTFNNTQFPDEQFFYGQVSFEASPLNRVLNTYAPGNSWVGSNKGISNQYLTNTTDDSVRIWDIGFTIGNIPMTSGTYPEGQLYKNITIDEQNHQVVEYKDKDGRVILKKVQLSSIPGTAHVGWLCTYYVYDDLENLRFVIQPKAVDALLSAGTWNLSSIANLTNELCFRYEYDERKRIIIKKVPGAAEQWTVYDVRDRVVMTQDSLQRASGKWVTNEYDSLNRVIRITLLTDNHDRAYHQNLAGVSTAYPNMTGATYEVIKQLYYDDYAWVFSPLPSAMDLSNVNNSTYFYTSYNASPAYAQNLVPNYQTRGMLTGQKVEVLNTNGVQNLSSVFFYDDRGRQIQRQSTNNVSGKDVSTTQYDFTGKVLRNLLNHQKQAGSFQNRTVVTRNSYDAMERILTIVKKIDNIPDQTIATYTYNELGQLQNKQLGNNIENLAYTYNIRGWLNTVNKDYVSDNNNAHYFGMELGYDNQASANTATTYTTPQFNGNISGMMWKTAGDGIARKYDFTYDNVNRLTGADFNQKASSGFDKTSNIDFSVNDLKYDANGNILSMNQKGYKAGASSFIDQLNYTYQANSNKLLQVTDGANDNTTKLGDFHFNSATKTSTDYSYDGNGNLISDNNKSITSILYSLYNGTPRQVKMKGKGTITYQYDADGNKLLETTVDSTGNPVKTFVKIYVEGFVYEGLQFQTDTFTYLNHEEGRARWAYHKYLNGTTKYGFEYDYFIKDHLGNTRVILTQQKDTARYLASMEGIYRATEKQLFNNIETTAYARSMVPAPGYPNDTTYSNPNDSVSRLNGNGPRTGPSLLLKVMTGDKVDIGVQSYYNNNSVSDTTGSLTDVLNSLANAIVGASGGAKGNVADLTNQSTGPLYGALNNFLSANDPKPASYPKAYLNWILLDEQLHYVSSFPQSYGIPAAGSDKPASQINPLSYTGIPITKSGYLYIWMSNETKGWDVFFDNLKVNHYAGPLLEETHYYPFGLTMAAISSQALKPLYYENKRKYNTGSELQNKEFSDGTGWEMYDFKFRHYDQQIGRFIQIDPTPDDGDQEDLSPYHFAKNNPIRYNDPDGKCPSCIIGAIIGAAVDYGTQVIANRLEGRSWSESLTQVDGKSILISAGAGALSGGVSALATKSIAGKVIAEAASTVIDAGESALKQYNENRTVSLKQTASDVIANKIGGALTEGVKVNSNSAIKTTEKQLDRAERKAANDATSSGRAATINKLENKLAVQKGTNEAINKVASGTVSNAVQGVSNASQGTNKYVPPPAYNAVDNVGSGVRKPFLN